MSWRVVATMLFIALAGLGAGCGGGSTKAADVTTYQVETVEVDTVGTTRQCDGLSAAKRNRQRRQLERDLAGLRAAAKTMKGYSQDGNAPMNAALDRFMIDIGKEALPVFQRSRFIDRAVAIVSSHCYLCFQTLEYNRPVAAGAKLACG
jgi:hypothetical protein